ncbi:MAG: universal stress protein [Deltaproteobacteria bacterium]|nr:universal stress protein [Deltaproteobacteria bacterium]MBN2686758.1 universal stress protein [Deltaproteobacteria bacterium]
MFSTVLFPTDFSRHADKILECIPDLQRYGMKEAVFVHVINPMKAAQWISVDEQIIEKAEREARKSIDDVVTHVMSLHGIMARQRIEIGVIYQEIVRVAYEEQASLIIMGSHGHGFVRTALLGSVAQNVLRTTGIPLIIEKFTYQASDESASLEFVSDTMFSRILFPTDFSENSLAVLKVLREMNSVGIETIYVAHIQDADRFQYFSTEKRQEFDQIDSERLSRLKQKIEFWGYTTKTILRDGYPAQEINRIAEDENVSMIIMGSHGRSVVKDALVGSVAESVALRHVRPLMIIP